MKIVFERIIIALYILAFLAFWLSPLTLVVFYILEYFEIIPSAPPVAHG